MPYRTKASQPMQIIVKMTVEEVRRACHEWFEANSESQPSGSFERVGFVGGIMHQGVLLEGNAHKNADFMFEFVWEEEIPK